MKINEVKDKFISVLIQMDKKVVALKGQRIEVEDDFFDSLSLPSDSSAIMTEVLRTEDGKAVSLDVDKIDIHIQTVVDNKMYSFFNVKHKRVRLGGENCECFYTIKEAQKIEQRKAYRCGISLPCQVARSSDTSAQSATLKDLSILGGSLLSTTLELKVGEYVTVRFSDSVSPQKEGEAAEKVNISFSATVNRVRIIGKFNEYGLVIKECNANVLSKYISTKQRLQIKKD